MQTGAYRVTSIRRYPVKSMGGEAHHGISRRHGDPVIRRELESLGGIARRQQDCPGQASCPQYQSRRQARRTTASGSYHTVHMKDLSAR